jgi:hypothetical protein
MRQDRRAGEILFVDYAGQTVAVVNMAASAIREAQIFVAVLGASNYTHAEAPGHRHHTRAALIRPGAGSPGRREDRLLHPNVVRQGRAKREGDSPRKAGA